MADIVWCLIFGFGLMAGIVWAATSAWMLVRNTYPLGMLLLSGAGFGLATWAGEHLHG